MGSKRLKKKVKKLRKLAVPIGAIALTATGVGAGAGAALLKGAGVVAKGAVTVAKPIATAVTTNIVTKKLMTTLEGEPKEEITTEPRVISVVDGQIAARSTEDGELEEVSPYLINPALPDPVIPVSSLGTATNVRKKLVEGAQFLTPTRLATAQQIGIDIPEDVQAEVSKIQMAAKSSKTPDSTPNLMLPLLIAGVIGISALILTRKK